MLGTGKIEVAGSTRKRLVGRTRELDTFTHALDRLSKDEPSIVVVSGEAGIGKTTLLHEVAGRAAERGQLTLTGRAAEFERDLPFAVFVDALSDHLEGLDKNDLQLPEETLEDLAAIFPPLAGLSPGSGRALQTERNRTYQAVRVLLEKLASERPLVLALDDLHWADLASLELLSNLVRRLPQASILFSLAFRPHNVPEQLDSALSEAASEMIVERLELPPLSRTEASELVDGSSGDALAQLYEESGGNPLYLEQLCRARGSDSDAASPAAHGLNQAGVPALVAASISRELASLGGTARVTLQAASMLGDSFELSLAAATAGISAAQAETAIDDALALDLVRTTDVPLRYSFRHPLVRHAVYESCGGGWRIGAHMRAADELERINAPAPLRAHHVELSAKVGDNSAIKLLTEAANATAPRAPALAAGWYEAAMRLLPETEENVSRRLQLLVPLGIALGSAGQIDRSRDVLRLVLDLLPELTPLRGAALSFSTTVEILLGNAEGARQDLVDALETLEAFDEHDPLIVADTMAGIAITHLFTGEVDAMRDWAHKSIKLFGDAPGPIPSLPMAALALAEYSRGDIPAAREAIAMARAVLDVLPDQEVIPRPAVFVWLGWAELLTENFEDAIVHFERGIRISREGGQEHLLVQMMHGQALALTWQGKIAEAQQVLEPAIESSMLSQNNLFLTIGLAVGSMVHSISGRPAEAVSLGERALRASDGAAPPMFRQLAVTSLAEAWLDCGEYRHCRGLLVDELEMADLPTWKVRSLTLLAQVELKLGNIDAAELWASEAQHLADTTGFKLVNAETKRARAAVLLAQERPAEARGLAHEAAEIAERIGSPVEAGRARIVEAQALAAVDDRATALTLLDRTETALTLVKAAGPSAAAVRELRRLGRRVQWPSEGDDGSAALTSRELEVAKLAVLAKRNREIAAELFISEKTVEQHLGRVFLKLGLSSRVEIGAALEALSSGQTAP